MFGFIRIKPRTNGQIVEYLKGYGVSKGAANRWIVNERDKTKAIKLNSDRRYYIPKRYYKGSDETGFETVESFRDISSLLGTVISLVTFLQDKRMASKCDWHLAKIKEIVNDSYSNLPWEWHANDFDPEKLLRKCTETGHYLYNPPAGTSSQHSHRGLDLSHVSDLKGLEIFDAFVIVLANFIIETQNKLVECHNSVPKGPHYDLLSSSCKEGIASLNRATQSKHILPKMWKTPTLSNCKYDKEQKLFSAVIHPIGDVDPILVKVFYNGVEQYYGTYKHDIRLKDIDRIYFHRPKYDKNHRHVLTIQVMCTEFSFDISKVDRSLGRPSMTKLSNIDPKIHRTIPLIPDMGGSIAIHIKRWAEKKITCHKCNKVHEQNFWIGHADDGGKIADKDGRGYWAQWWCPYTNATRSLKKLSIVTEKPKASAKPKSPRKAKTDNPKMSRKTSAKPKSPRKAKTDNPKMSRKTSAKPKTSSGKNSSRKTARKKNKQSN